MVKPDYVYVASSWRNPLQPMVCSVLKAAGIEHYDFRNPTEGRAGFSWKDVGEGGQALKAKGGDLVTTERYLEMVNHSAAVEAYAVDFAAMERADAFVLVLPCGKSAHLELGWAVGQGKETAILLEENNEPELMYRMVDYIAPNLFELLGWLGVED